MKVRKLIKFDCIFHKLKTLRELMFVFIMIKKGLLAVKKLVALKTFIIMNLENILTFYTINISHS